MLNILFNVLLPVIILNKLSQPLGSLYALLLALSFPLAYGMRDLVLNRKVNGFSLLGITNVAITGGFALSGLSGIWFSFKEAAFPLLIGIFVFASAYTRRPFMKTLFLNPSMVDVPLIEQSLDQSQLHSDFEDHLRQSTRWLSGSFFLSAALNFLLAQRVFTPLNPELDSEAKAQVINEQIAHMTSLSFGVIVLPSMILMFAIIWYLLRGIQKTTGLKYDQIMKG